MKPTPEQVLADAKKQIGETPHLCYMHYDECMSDENITAILEGDDIDFDWIDEKQHDGATFLINELDEEMRDVLEATVSGDPKYGMTLMDDLREWVLEHDQSNPLDDALRNTHDKTFRLYLGESTGVTWMDDACDVDTEVGHIAERFGFEFTDGVSECLRTVLANAGDGGTLNLLWRGDVAQVVNAIWKGEAMLWTFENPEFLILNRMVGSGFCETLPGKVTVTVPALADRTEDDPCISLDVGSRSYSEGIVGGMSLPTIHPTVEFLDPPVVTIVEATPCLTAQP